RAGSILTRPRFAPAPFSARCVTCRGAPSVPTAGADYDVRFIIPRPDIRGLKGPFDGGRTGRRRRRVHPRAGVVHGNEVGRDRPGGVSDVPTAAGTDAEPVNRAREHPAEQVPGAGSETRTRRPWPSPG